MPDVQLDDFAYDQELQKELAAGPKAGQLDHEMLVIMMVATALMWIMLITLCRL